MKRATGCVLMLLALALLPAASMAGKTKKAEAGGDEPKWLTSYADALAQAKESGKIVMADFTGSDWCGYCIKLKQQVFTSAEFKAFASKNLVLLEVDFPHKTKLPEDVAQQNKDLQKKFDVHGYPTCIFISGDGTEIGRTRGFGSADSWWKQVKAIMAKAKK